MNDVRIRPALPAEAEAIARVHVEVWRESYRGFVPDDLLDALSVGRSAEMWECILGQKEQAICVAESGEPPGAACAIVGFGAAAPAQSASLGTTGEVTALFVVHQFKRRGIGRALFFRLLDALSRAGHRSAGAWVLIDNRQSRIFYEAMRGRAGARRFVPEPPVAMHEIAYVWDELQL